MNKRIATVGAANNTTLYNGILPAGVSCQVSTGYNNGNSFVVIT